MSLPSELLVEIGFHVAPLGGARISAFRLASPHLSRVLAPVLWASLLFSSDIHILDPLLAAIQEDDGGHNALVTSVRFEVPDQHFAFPVAVLRLLRNLKHLQVVGVGMPLGVSMQKAVRGALELETLVLESLDLTDRYDLATWAPSVRNLVVQDCQSQDDLFDNGHALIARAPLEVLDYSVPSSFPASDQSAIVMNALQAVQATAKSVILHWAHAEDFSHIDIGGPCSVRSFPIKLQIIGLPDLFSPAEPLAHQQATHAVVKLLNWVSESPLTEVTLPFQNAFTVGPGFTSLRLPHLLSLSLVRNIDPPGRNLLNQETYLALISLLSTVTEHSPLMTRLCLVGWFDKIGAGTVAASAAANPWALATTHVFLVGLLHGLRGTSVMELRLKNSEGQREAEGEGVFWREGKEDWKVREAKFW
ncbi:hypothetical protein RQP46_010463 [Phenoliferia psychrophenolica]